MTRLIHMLPETKDVYPEKSVFKPGGNVETVFMNAPWNKVALYSFDRDDNVACVQVAPLESGFNYVGSHVSPDGTKLAVLLGNDIENVCMGIHQSRAKWRVTQTQQGHIESMPSISKGTKRCSDPVQLIVLSE